jgi:hypothetical protein
MSLAHSCQRSVLVSIFFILFSTSIASPAAPASENKPHWILVSSSHFSVLTDADEKKANAVLLRMEQMRIVFGQLLSRTQLTMSEPLDIIAFNTREEYVQFSLDFFCPARIATSSASTYRTTKAGAPFPCPWHAST